MASYDSPGFQDVTPAGLVAESTGAPGTPSPGALPDTDSAGTGPETGTVGNSAYIVPNFGSLISGDRVTVGPLDTGVSSQADSYGPTTDPMTGIGTPLGDTGAGHGSVVQGPHPNNMNTGSLAAQTAAARRPS